MYRLAVLLPAIFLISCSPSKTEPPLARSIPNAQAPTKPPAVLETQNSVPFISKNQPKKIPSYQPATEKPPVNAVKTQPPRLQYKNIHGISINYVSFDSRTHRLRVVDQANGPGSKFPTAREACFSINGLAAINAGFFTPEGKPLGLVYTGGKKRGYKNSSSLGSGYFYENSAGHSKLLRKNSFPGIATEALQTGPFLIENNSVVSSLSNKNIRPRSFIIWDGRNTWGIATSSSASLSGLASALKGQTFNGRPIRYALNLDGGRSCDLYASAKISGGPKHKRSIIAKPVRNFLVLTKR